MDFPMGSRWRDRYPNDDRTWVVVDHPDLHETYMQLEGQDPPLFHTIEHINTELGPLTPAVSLEA